MEFRDGFWDLRALGRGGVRRHGGFAPLIVLWGIVFISFLSAQVPARGRTELRIATNLLANSIAQAAADGAIYEAIFHLLDPRADERWVLDGNNREILIGSTRVIVRLEDEAWRINPNLASLDLLEALLRNTGTGADAAHAIAKAITEWVGSSPATRTKTAML